MMEDLPDELLLRILDLLPDSDLINVVPRVCLRWSRLSLDSHIWKNRTYNVGRVWYEKYWQSCSAAVKFFSREPALGSVAIHLQVDKSVLRCLASHCRTITSLTLHCEQPLALDTLRLILHNCVQIRELRVPSEALRSRDRAREVALMPRLETLGVEGWQPLQLRELGVGCARLRRLDLGKAEQFNFADLGAPLLRRLQELTILFNALSRDIVHCAESLEKLKLTYDAHNPSRPDSALAEDLLPLKALTYVYTMGLDHSPLILSAFMQPLLRSLTLMSCENLNDDLVLELCRRCPLLEDLNLSHCDGITARGLSSMWRLGRLRCLSLNMCGNLGSGAMTHLARCDGLQNLHLFGLDMSNMEPGACQLLELRNLRNLEFDLWYARNLIPWEMFPKAFPDLKTLQLGEWKSRDTTLPESLKAAMTTVDVTWFVIRLDPEER